MKKVVRKIKKNLFIGAATLATLVSGVTLSGCSKDESTTAAIESLQAEMESLKAVNESLEARYGSRDSDNVDNTVKDSRENEKNESNSQIIMLTPIEKEPLETTQAIEVDMSIDDIIRTVSFDSVTADWMVYNSCQLEFYLSGKYQKKLSFTSLNEFLTACEKLNCMERFCFNSVDLTDSATLQRVISILERNPQLQTVSFNFCNINDDIMGSLASKLPRQILELNVVSNNLTNLDILKYFSFPNLERLNVSNNTIFSISGLSYLENVNGLNVINLDNNLIVDSSPLKRFPNLSTVWLYNNFLEDPTLLPTQCEILGISGNHWDVEDIEALEAICTEDKIDGEYHYYPGYWSERISSKVLTKTLE